MSSLTRYFFAPVAASDGILPVIAWWEKRRPAYNLAVGAAGLVSLAAVNVISLLPPISDPLGVPLIAVAIYAVLANVCYSAGPIGQILVRKFWDDRYEVVGPSMFRHGFIFSIGLTLLPIPLAVAAWVVTTLERLL